MARKTDSTRPAPKPPTTVTYPIRAVAAMTGVAIDTLRAWERRYAAVTPGRDDRGRTYTDDDIRRITLLRDAVQRGHAIGRVASMTNDQLVQLTRTATLAPPAGNAPETSTPLHVNRDAIIAALERFDAASVELQLGRAAALLPAPELMRELVLPVLAEVGERWHSARGRVAHEHMLSASIRNVLGSLMRVHLRSGVRDRLLLATPAGERHEFGTLGAAMLALSGGLGAIYLGPDMPADDIVAVTEVVAVDVVILGVSGASDAARIEVEVGKVASRLRPDIELWLGGAGAAQAASSLRGRVQVVPDFESLEQQLVRLGARF